ncbi:MAG: hypothetical protein KGS45_06605 [Planctomycetes bacterium]|nr:hypothetical protein [Planctomycetota bacterium]
MPHRRLTPTELTTANTLLTEIRAKIATAASGDEALFWALRRKIFKELMHDERGQPMARQALKEAKRHAQGGLCVVCQEQLPEKNSVLDRLEAMKGYTVENTRLLCPSCDTRLQEAKVYS